MDSDSEEDDEYDYVMPWYRPEWFDRLHPVYQELLLALVRVVLPAKPFRGAFSQIGSREWGGTDPQRDPQHLRLDLSAFVAKAVGTGYELVAHSL